MSGPYINCSWNLNLTFNLHGFTTFCYWKPVLIIIFSWIGGQTSAKNNCSICISLLYLLRNLWNKYSTLENCADNAAPPPKFVDRRRAAAKKLIGAPPPILRSRAGLYLACITGNREWFAVGQWPIIAYKLYLSSNINTHQWSYTQSGMFQCLRNLLRMCTDTFLFRNKSLQQTGVDYSYLFICFHVCSA